jgi:hypothetical protein
MNLPGLAASDNLIRCLYLSVAPHPDHGQYVYMMAQRDRAADKLPSTIVRHGVAEDQELVRAGFDRFSRDGGIHGAESAWLAKIRAWKPKGKGFGQFRRRLR